MRKICVIDWQSYPSLCDTLFSVYSMIRLYGFYPKRMIRHYVIHPTNYIMCLRAFLRVNISTCWFFFLFCFCFVCVCVCLFVVFWGGCIMIAKERIIIMQVYKCISLRLYDFFFYFFITSIVLMNIHLQKEIFRNYDSSVYAASKYQDIK